MREWNSTAEIIIIGGGILGASVNQMFIMKVVEALVQRAPVMADSKMIKGWD
jgi:precorrin isomerase